MVNYTEFRDELKWYFDGDTAGNEDRILEVSQLLSGGREEFDDILEAVEKKFPNMTRTQELIGQASFVDRETRKYDGDGGSYIQMAIYRPEGVKSAIIISRTKGYDMAGQPFYLYRVHPTTDVENKIQNDVLYDDQEYTQVK